MIMRSNSRVIGLLGRALELEMESAQQHATRATLASLWGQHTLAEQLVCRTRKWGMPTSS